MQSKKLVSQHIQNALDAGATRKEIARALGVKGANYISMLKGHRDESLLSPEKIRPLAQACHLSKREVMKLALARLRDGSGTVEMSVETFKYLLRTFGALLNETHAVRRGA